MPRFALKLTDPKGIVKYYPVGYGFTVHACVATEREAMHFATKAQAQRAINGLWWPPDRWSSEPEPARSMRAEFKGWQYDIVDV